ncbi:probable oligoribonuclease isoform X2 [Diachasma alloeum]|nr:probable oligoribonuclease isoform X2 [Diachasma alloeum]XP_015117944.1 probable oligoribonuclease isoform X2 [Diachasma alloeum]
MLKTIQKVVVALKDLPQPTRRFNLSKHVGRKSTMAESLDQSIVWMDMEMSGLDIFKDHILEIACLVTDKELNVKSSDFHLIIHQPDEVLNSMNEWCTENHKSTGLSDAVRSSEITLESAEQQLLTFLKKYVPEKSCPLAGNSIYMDRLFLRVHMPIANEYLHYRVIDVSTIVELAKRWNAPAVSADPKKLRLHRAIDDVRESIEQLKYYKSTFFKTLQ